MNPSLLVQLHRLVAHQRKDLSRTQVAALVIEIANANGAVITRDGDCLLRPEGQALIDAGKPPGTKTPQAPPPAPASTLAADLAAVPAGPRAQAQRARVREQHARTQLGERYRPSLEKP